MTCLIQPMLLQRRDHPSDLTGQPRLWLSLSPLEYAVPGGGKHVGPLVSVYCPLCSFSDFNCLHDPALVFVFLSADDFGLFPVHNVVLSFAVICNC